MSHDDDHEQRARLIAHVDRMGMVAEAKRSTETKEGMRRLDERTRVEVLALGEPAVRPSLMGHTASSTAPTSWCSTARPTGSPREANRQGKSHSPVTPGGFRWASQKALSQTQSSRLHQTGEGANQLARARVAIIGGALTAWFCDNCRSRRMASFAASLRRSRTRHAKWARELARLNERGSGIHTAQIALDRPEVALAAKARERPGRFAGDSHQFIGSSKPATLAREGNLGGIEGYLGIAWTLRVLNHQSRTTRAVVDVLPQRPRLAGPSVSDEKRLR